MPGLNKVMLIGRLGRDPETRWFEGGKAMCTLSLATSETFRNGDAPPQERTEWHRVVLWRDLARVADEHLNKGDRIYIEGRLRTRSWQDGDGVQHRSTEVVADRMDMLGSPKAANGAASDNTGRDPGSPSTPASMDGASLPS